MGMKSAPDPAGADPPPLLEHRTIVGEDGEPIHYYVGGRTEPTAPLLVFLHGLGSNHSRWHRLARQPFFQQHCRVIVLDLRGHGASHARRRIDQEGIGRDLGLLLEHENAHRAILVGHCLGANLAVRAWELSAERIAGLVFIEPFIVSALRRRLRFAHAALLPLVWCIYGAVRMLNDIGLRRTHFRTIDFESYDEWVRPRLTSFWAAVRWMGPVVDLQTMPVMSYLQAFETLFAYRPRWAAISCPTLVIYGKKAELAGADGQQPLVDNPNVQVRSIEASHFVLTDNVQGVASAIESFVRGGRRLDS